MFLQTRSAAQLVRTLITTQKHCLRARYVSTKSRLVEVAEEVEHAVKTRRPVVALETTIYTHGTCTFFTLTRVCLSTNLLVQAFPTLRTSLWRLISSPW